jgi:glycosyltransferase involved in cell wall biosynthesis
VEALILSYALDTNGQNARYAKAAERFGTSKAVLKALAIGNADPAGVVARFQIAADKLGELKIRSVHRTQAYFDFPADIAWTRKNEREISRLIEASDVVHLNNSYRAAMYFRIRKPMLLHHHGSLFRNNTRTMLQTAKARRMTQAVSTIDLTRADPEVLHWLPTAYDIRELQRVAKLSRRKPDGRVRIVHAPTNRALKHTNLLIAVVNELQAEGLPVDLELVEGVTNAECLRAKAQADIVFDQLMFGYGCNAVEAWGMGVPVICGADPWTLDAMRREWGALPFYEADTDTLKERIREMVESKDLRDEYAGIGLAHVRKYHDEAPALARLAELYVKTIKGAQSGRAIPGKPADAVTFRSSRQNRVAFGDVEAVFVNGQAEVTDPDLIMRLRHLAGRKSYGIEEVTEGAA